MDTATTGPGAGNTVGNPEDDSECTDATGGGRGNGGEDATVHGRNGPDSGDLVLAQTDAGLRVGSDGDEDEAAGWTGRY